MLFTLTWRLSRGYYPEKKKIYDFSETAPNK